MATTNLIDIEAGLLLMAALMNPPAEPNELEIGEEFTFGKVKVERLDEVYYHFSWSCEKFDHTRRVHCYNVRRELDEANTTEGIVDRRDF